MPHSRSRSRSTRSGETPNEETYFKYMLSYSPYDNLKAASYPAMLVKTSLNDSQVMYWEPAKYVARAAHSEDG